MFPPCPFLPLPDSALDWRALHAFRSSERGGSFYLTCLQYGQAQWTRGLAARALLCLDRAFGADVKAEAPELRQWPLPYAAMGWILANTPPTTFIGNPRVHFQHYADRMNEPRREQRQTRAWACWALARAVRPAWPGDPRHLVREPTEEEIAVALDRFGHPHETALWQAALHAARWSPPSAPTV